MYLIPLYSFPVLPKAQARIFHHISFLQQARDRQKRKTSLIRPIPLQFHFDIQFLTMIRNVGLPLLRCLVDIKLPLFGQPPLPIFIFFAVFIAFLILYHNKLDILLIFLTWRSQTRRDIRKEWWKGLRPLPPSRRIHRHHLVHRNRIRRVSWVGWRWLRFGFSVNWIDTNYRYVCLWHICREALVVWEFVSIDRDWREVIDSTNCLCWLLDVSIND